MAEGHYVDVDVSDILKKAELLKSLMTPKEGEAMVYAAFKRVGGHTRKIMKQDLPRHYEIAATPVGQAVGNARVRRQIGGVECLIPIKGKRGTIGGRFRADGGAAGWACVGHKYRIRARMVKGERSTLPEQMEHQGGQPPFINTTAPKLHGAAFTRVGRDQKPIVRVAGLAIPQMPMNRAEDDVQEDLRDYLNTRIEAEFKWRMRKCGCR